ncbi:MAG: TlpA disulfide reductase family protein [Gammaproteobacteria bacterium]|nr:TlpA disulfide reductase family protein [Gammaproteobacteria bacterium]
MNSNTRKIVFAVLGAVLAVATVWIHYEVKTKVWGLGGFGMGGSIGAPSKFNIGDAIPDFSGTRLSGEVISLAEFRDEQVVVLDFWATWCQPCVQGMPTLQELHEELGELGVQVLAINVGEDIDTVREFIETEGYSFPVVLDQDSQTKSEFGVQGIPQLFVVGKDGSLRHHSVGSPVGEDQMKLKAKQLKQLIVELLQEPKTLSTQV